MTAAELVARMALGAALLASSGCAPDRGDVYVRSVADARRAYHAGRFAEAAASYDEAARSAKVPRDAVFARYEAALARVRAGDVASGARELRAIAGERPPNAYSAEAAFKVADLTFAADEARGLVELESIALAFPESGVARVALLRILRHEDSARDPEATLAHLDALAPKLAGTGLAETIAFERAKRLSAVGRTAEARDAFVEVARRWPYPRGAFFDDALYLASEEEERLGRPREAITLLEHLLSHRETSDVIGSYQRPRYGPALLRIAELHEEKLHDRTRAREALHRLYAEFTTSAYRDDALFREAALFREDGDAAAACARLELLTRELPDSRYVPCAVEQCPGLRRPAKSKAPTTCRDYLKRRGPPAAGD